MKPMKSLPKEGIIENHPKTRDTIGYGFREIQCFNIEGKRKGKPNVFNWGLSERFVKNSCLFSLSQQLFGRFFCHHKKFVTENIEH